MTFTDALRTRYVSFFGEERPATSSVSNIESALGVQFPQDFLEIASFFRGGLLGGISHNSIANGGHATNIVDETIRLRAAVALPPSMVLLAEPPVSLIVLDTDPLAAQRRVIWCDSIDVERLLHPVSLRNPELWESYADFFSFLLEREAEEREEGF